MPTSSSGLPQRLGRRAALHPGVEGRVVDQRLVHVGQHVAGADGVGLDAVLGPFRRHGAGQHLDAALGHRVGRDGRAGQLAGQRADVDDLAAAARDHPPRRLAADHEGAGQVGLDHPAPVVGRELDHRLAQLDAGIVDEDVDRDALARRAARRRRRSRPRRSRRSGASCTDDPAARISAAACGEPAGIGAVQDDRGAGRGQSLGHGAAEAARGAGDEGGAAGEVEQAAWTWILRPPSGGR